MEPLPNSLEAHLAQALPRLRAHLNQRTPDPEDVAQEVLARALRYGGSFDLSRPLWPWLRRLVEHVLHDQAAAAERRPRAEADLDPSAPEQPLAIDEREDVEALLAHLRPIERDVLLRFHQRGDSIASIAASLDLPEGTIKSHLSRARMRLGRLPLAEE